MAYNPAQPLVSYTSYFPSLIEILSGSGIIAYGLLAFSIGVRYLKVVDHRITTEEHETVTVEAAQGMPI
jgi:Ni/Fe-hydrogenase subunit HybB-like protein